MALAAQRAVLADSLLFAALMPPDRLRDMVRSAKAISDTVCLEFDSGNEDRNLRYWAVDDNRTCAMVGLPDNSLLQEHGKVAGDDVPHTIQVSVKHFLPKVNALDMKRPVEVRLCSEGNKWSLVLRQANQDGEPDTHKITVQASDSKPVAPVIGQAAYAAVDLVRFNKVLTGLKPNTDIVTLRIGPNLFEAVSSTRSMQDEWQHPTTTKGKETGLFATAFLKKVVSGAKEAADLGEVYLSEGHPLRLQAVSEDLTVQYFVAGRDVMK